MSDGWRVDGARDCLGVFADPADAVSAACRHARADADGGQVAMVTTETVPQEFHCYIPPPAGQADTIAAALPPYLRLVTEAG